MQTELSTVLNFVERNRGIKKADIILLIISSVPQEKFCSLDFICQNAFEGYQPEEHKTFRGSISAILSIMDTKGLIEKRVIPFDPEERKEFARNFILGEIINIGPRKTKTVFSLSQRGRTEASKIQTTGQGLINGKIEKYN